jgi:hypothetical protein
MSERDHQLSASPQDRALPPSAVRIIRAVAVVDRPEAVLPPSNAEPAGPPAVLRPEHLDQLTDVVDQLRSGRAVRLTLDGLADRAERRRACAFLEGAVYALGVEATTAGASNDTIMLDPRTPESHDPRLGSRAPAPPPRARTTTAPRDVTGEATCVLCDLRVADRKIAPPLEMVLQRDGSRIWSPRAMVCSHCRTTIRHWRFALAWCAECERWGRRNVVSPCGQLFG